MKKLMLCLLLVLACCLSAALAAGDPSAHTTVTALAIEFDPERPASVAVNARITAYAPAQNALTLELIVPERFDREDVESLAVGDAIYTQGQEVVIQTLTERDGYLVINEGEYELSEGSVWLYEDMEGSYQIADWDDDHTWTVAATLQVPVGDSLIFLDQIDPATGDILSMPTVHGAEEFLAQLARESAEGGPGFTANNVYVAFDANGQLALIQRYYVSWQ